MPGMQTSSENWWMAGQAAERRPPAPPVYPETVFAVTPMPRLASAIPPLRSR